MQKRLEIKLVKKRKLETKGYKNSKEGSGRWWEKKIADRFDSEIAYGDGIKRR